MPMPPGGFADKLGNRYEAHYVIAAALELIDGDRETLRWEGLGAEFRGVEYRSRLSDGTVEVVQCKGSTDAGWSIAALSREGILATIKDQFVDHGAHHFTLVVATQAMELRDLTQRARATSAVRAFDEALSVPLRQALMQILGYWGLGGDDKGLTAAWQWLSRVTVREQETPERLGRLAERRCADLFDAPAGTAKAAVREVLEAHLGEEITAARLISLLQADPFKINVRDWGRLPERVAAVHALRERFLRQLRRPLIRGTFLDRVEVGTTIAAIDKADGPKVVLLHGAAGMGKSGVLYEVVRQLTERGVCVVPLRLDTDPPAGHLLRYSREALGLPDTPVRCARRLSPHHTAVVVVDQLDAIRWASVQSTSAWDTTLELLDEAVGSQNVKVVVACRTFDVHDDPNLRAWRQSRVNANQIQEISIGGIDEKRVTEVVQESSGAVPNAPQLKLLSNPLMLSLWCELSTRGIDLSGIAASSHLLRAHWSSTKARIRGKHDISEPLAEQTIGEVVGWFEAQGRIDFPAHAVVSQAALDALASEGYLDRLGAARYRVTHQRFLDHQVAVSVFKGISRAKSTVAQWVADTEQGLMRREQVRQVLALLRDDGAGRYVREVEGLLTDERVREHVKDLALRLLGDASPISDEERALVLRLLADSKWTDRVRSRTLSSSQWRLVLIEVGLVEQWLGGSAERDWQWAAWMCARLADTHAPVVSELLKSMTRRKQLDPARRLRCLPFASRMDTDAMAKWRFQAQRRGEIRCESYEIVNSAKEAPQAGLRFARHVFRWRIAHIIHPRLMPSDPGEKFGRHSSDQGVFRKELLAIAAAIPEEAMRALSPLLLRHLKWLKKRQQRLPKDERRLPWNHSSRGLNTIMRRMLVSAISALPANEAKVAWSLLRPFARLSSRTAQRLIASAIPNMTAPLPRDAAAWVVADLRRCGVHGTRHNLRRYWRGRALVKVVWEKAPYEQGRLLKAIKAFHDPHERLELQYQAKRARAGRVSIWPNHVGLPQYLLLSALPFDQIDDEARDRLWQWDAKFCWSSSNLRLPRPPSGWLQPPSAYAPTPGPLKPGTPNGVIPAERVGSVPDHQWLRIAEPSWTERMKARWRSRPHYSFETPEAMAEAAFRQAARGNPSRFIRLGTRLPLTAPESWFEALLDVAAMTEAEAGTSNPRWKAASAVEIEGLLSHMGVRDGKHVTLSLARLVQTRPTDGWSTETIDRLCTLAVSHEDPRLDDLTGNQTLDQLSASVVLSIGINSTRGVAIKAIEQLMWKRQLDFHQYVAMAEQAVRDPHPAIRVVAIGLAGPLLDKHTELALSLLETACGGTDERVLHSRELAHLLDYLWGRADPRVERVVRRMAMSMSQELVRLGAHFATVIAVKSDRLVDLMSTCRSGTPDQRIGVASALTRLIQPSYAPEPVVEQLAQMFDDDDAHVASAAAGVFRDDELMRSHLGPRLAAAFVESAHFARDPDDLLFPLERFTGDLKDFHPVLATIVQRARADMSGLRGDMRKRGYDFADNAAEMVLRVYSRAQEVQDASVRAWCLDQFDALLADGHHLGEKLFDSIDTNG